MSLRATAEPMNPAPPVTRNLNDVGKTAFAPFGWAHIGDGHAQRKPAPAAHSHWPTAVGADDDAVDQVAAFSELIGRMSW